jgi:Fasciclin domain
VSTTGLFVVGVLVTLIVAAAMGLLIYAAILDGRDPADRDPASPPRAVESPAAPDTLADVVNHHLVPGRVPAPDIAGRMSAGTPQGEDLAISNHGVLRIDGARLGSGDIEASQ